MSIIRFTFHDGFEFDVSSEDFGETGMGHRIDEIAKGHNGVAKAGYLHLVFPIFDKTSLDDEFDAARKEEDRRRHEQRRLKNGECSEINEKV